MQTLFTKKGKCLDTKINEKAPIQRARCPPKASHLPGSIRPP